MGLDDYRDVAFFDDVAHFAPDLGDVPNHAVGYRRRSLIDRRRDVPRRVTPADGRFVVAPRCEP